MSEIEWLTEINFARTTNTYVLFILFNTKFLHHVVLSDENSRLFIGFSVVIRTTRFSSIYFRDSIWYDSFFIKNVHIRIQSTNGTFHKILLVSNSLIHVKLVHTSNMYSTEIPRIINQLIAVFYKIGIWNVPERTKFAQIGLKLFHSIYYTTFVMSFVVGAFLTTDPDELVILSVGSIALSLNIVRFFYIISKQNEILNFIHVIGSHTANEGEEFVEVNRKLKNFTKFSTSFLTACIVNLVFFAIFPFLLSKKTIVDIAFPQSFPWENGPSTYWIEHAFIIVGSMYAILWTSLSVIILYLMLNGAIKYEMLGNRLRILGQQNVNKKQKVLKTELFLEDLIATIENHQKINE